MAIKRPFKPGAEMTDIQLLEERIGEGLVKRGLLKQEQVQDVLLRQKAGDSRLFGEIAVEQKYIKIQDLIQFLMKPGD